MEKFTDFWGGILKDNEKITYQPWMIEVEQKIRQKMEDVRKQGHCKGNQEKEELDCTRD